MTATEVVEGSVAVKIGRREYHLAPLNLGGVKRLYELQKAPVNPDSPEGIDQSIEVLLLSLRRNHPEVTAEVLLDAIDSHNIGRLLDKVLEVAGLVPKAVGETPPTAPPVP